MRMTSVTVDHFHNVKSVCRKVKLTEKVRCPGQKIELKKVEEERKQKWFSFIV